MSQIEEAMDAARAAAAADLPRWRGELESLVRIPSVSAPGFDHQQVTRSAEASAALLEQAGMPDVTIAAVEGGMPNVIGAREDRPGAPTVLLYAHHDVQPPGFEDRWSSDPFEPVERDGRLYGRGSADDKAGAVAHAAVIAAWLATAGTLPVNVKVLVEGEEEIGSPTLFPFLSAHRDALAADVLVLADAGNWSVGTPGLTYSLRGMGSITVTVGACDFPQHSGMTGGVLPDPAMALARMLASLVDDCGDVAVPGFTDDVRAPTPDERAAIGALGGPTDALRRAWSVRPGVHFAGDAARSIYERLWQWPSITVIGFDSHPIAGSSNQIVASASARLSVRLAPGQDPERALGAIERHLRAAVPFGLELSIAEDEGAAPAWVCEPEGPAFDAATAALSEGFGRPPVLMGVGGSIPFVGPFADAFGGIPALLLGPADPTSRIHGEDESLHLGDWQHLIESEVLLLGELAERL